VENQHPAVPLTEEQRIAIRKDFEELMQARQEKIDPGEIGRQMAEQRGRIGRMISFLDMCPTPGEGRGA
jgi:hypothetical protein